MLSTGLVFGFENGRDGALLNQGFAVGVGNRVLIEGRVEALQLEDLAVLLDLNVITLEVDHSKEAGVKNKSDRVVGVSILFGDFGRAEPNVELMDIVREVEPLFGRLVFAELEEFQHLAVVAEMVRLEGQISRFTVAQLRV